VRPLQSAACRGFIEPSSPGQNPLMESFGSGVRDEVLAEEAFDSVLDHVLNAALEPLRIVDLVW